MSTLSDIVAGRSAAGAVIQAIGNAMTRWWGAYMAWRIERWAIGRLQAIGDPQLKATPPRAPDRVRRQRRNQQRGGKVRPEGP